FRQYIAQVIANAKTLAAELQRFGFRIVSGGTDNHMLLADVTSRGLTGKIAEQALDHAGITVNKNMIPFDVRKPLDPSGIRIGTPALTTGGMKEAKIGTIAEWINEALTHAAQKEVLDRTRGTVRELCNKSPAPTN